MKAKIIFITLIIASSSFAGFPKLVVSDINKETKFNGNLTEETNLKLEPISVVSPTSTEVTKIETSEIIAQQNQKIEIMYSEIDKAYRLAMAYPKFDQVKLHKLSYFGKRLQQLRNSNASIEELEQFYTELKTEINKGK